MPNSFGGRGFGCVGDASAVSVRRPAPPPSALAFALAAALLLAALVVSACWLGMRGRAAFCDPDPLSKQGVLPAESFLESVFDSVVGGVGGNVHGSGEENDFPRVDWNYWCEVNPDVVGWITVPGTVVNGPIVLASSDDPDYYLSHDVYGDYSWYGCFYLDASCAVGGLLGSRNAVVFGHNMSQVDGSMFTAFSEYTDLGFALSHAEILLQAPDAKERLSVVGARVISGESAIKRTLFASDEDFEAYRDDCFSSCEMVIPLIDEAKELGELEGLGEAKGLGETMGTTDALSVSNEDGFFTFVTCSYTRYQNERTLVYAVLRE